MNELEIAVCMPTIPDRHRLRARMLKSIWAQTRMPDDLVIAIDHQGDGVTPTRNRAIFSATADWVALVDDDDELYRQHLELLEQTAVETGADLVYSWHDLAPSAPNPLAVAGESPEGRPFDDTARDWLIERGNFIPITVLVRRHVLLAEGGFHDFGLDRWDPDRCEIRDMWTRLLRAGARFEHFPGRTWRYHRHGQNTAGMSWRKQAGGVHQQGYADS